MRILSPIKISYTNLMSAKLRSFLSILGIIIGVASVIMIFAFGKAAQELILDRVRGVGSNLIAVLPGASDEDGPPAQAFGISVTTLKYRDLQALTNKKKVPEVEAGAGYARGTAIVSSDNEEASFSVVGTTATYVKVENTELAEGRFFTEGEERGMARVAILGPQTVEDLFGDEDPINKRIEIKNHNFKIIGVFKERGSTAFGTSQDDAVFIPLRTAQKLLLGINHLAFIRLKVKDADLVSSAMKNVKATLREQHDIDDPDKDDFSVRNQEAALKSLTGITDVLRYFLLAVGSVSLLVGGVGIMNIMLIAVNQRIREVGLRKAVGAKTEDVLVQFLIESVFVSVVGGVLGIILGISVSFLVSIIVKHLGYNWQLIISIESLLLAVSVSAGIGILFGIYPAKKASKISPMEALRYE